MATYHNIAEPLSPGKRASRRLVWTALWLVGFSAIVRLVSGHWTNTPTIMVIGGSVASLGTLLTTSLWPRKEPTYDLEVDQDEISMVWNRKVVRRVRRSQIRSVREWGSGPFRKLVISERSPAFTRWLLGGIGVPASLPEYEQIKAQALNWLDSSSK